MRIRRSEHTRVNRLVSVGCGFGVALMLVAGDRPSTAAVRLDPDTWLRAISLPGDIDIAPILQRYRIGRSLVATARITAPRPLVSVTDSIEVGLRRLEPSAQRLDERTDAGLRVTVWGFAEGMVTLQQRSDSSATDGLLSVHRFDVGEVEVSDAHDGLGRQQAVFDDRIGARRILTHVIAGAASAQRLAERIGRGFRDRGCRVADARLTGTPATYVLSCHQSRTATTAVVLEDADVGYVFVQSVSVDEESY